MSTETTTTTTAEPKTLALSQEDQAAINWARNLALSNYRTRIENCVKRGKIPPKLAKERGTPLLQDLQLAFDAEGKPVPGPLDLVLEAWEAIPDHACLTGQSPASARATKGAIFSEQAFSLSAGLEEVPGPDLDTDPAESPAPLTEEQADAIVEQQLQAAGYPESRIAGGYSKK